MVIAMRVKFDVSRTLSLFQSLPKNIRKEIGNGMFEIGKSYQRGLRFQLNRTSKRFDNKIFDGIKAVRKSNNQTVVNMPREGYWLDDMETHVVPLVHRDGRRRTGSAIVRWADARGYKGNFITVRAHPFINAGMKRGRKSRQKIMQRSMDLAINNSRK